MLKDTFNVTQLAVCCHQPLVRAKIAQPNQDAILAGLDICRDFDRDQLTIIVSVGSVHVYVGCEFMAGDPSHWLGRVCKFRLADPRP
jgi:hypothetical protein